MGTRSHAAIEAPGCVSGNTFRHIIHKKWECRLSPNLQPVRDIAAFRPNLLRLDNGTRSVQAGKTCCWSETRCLVNRERGCRSVQPGTWSWERGQHGAGLLRLQPTRVRVECGKRRSRQGRM